MDKYLQFNELNLLEAADFLGITVNHLLMLIINGSLKAKFKDPFRNDGWHTIDSSEIKRSFDSGSKTIDLVTLFEDEEDATSNWDILITFEQAKIFKDELIQYKSTKTPKALKIIKSDMTEFVFDNETFVFKDEKASLIKVLYNKVKSNPEDPAMKENDIFRLAEYVGNGERIDRIFRTQRRPQILGNLVLRVAPSTFRLAPFIEAKN